MTADEAPRVAPAAPTVAPVPRRLIVLFFFSGFPALLYQVVWQRALFGIYGVNIESVTVVVSAFMLGLGLGSLLGGQLSALPLSRVALFGLVELGTAAYGLVSLPLFHRVAVATSGASTLATGLWAFALIVVPTVLMGSTLPLLVAHMVRLVPNMGRTTGTLYFANTLGSATACFVAGHLTMRALGQSGSVMLAAAVNATIGALALASYFSTRRGAGEERDADPDRAAAIVAPPSPALRDAAHLGRWLGIAVASVGGFIALSWEIVWYRVFSFASATNPRTFADMLGAYLLGLALGSYGAERLCTTERGDAEYRRFAARALVAGSLVALMVAPLLSNVVVIFMSFPAAQWVGLGFLTLAAALLGTTFPLVSHLSIAPDARAGESLSHLYVGNIVGSALGSFVTGYVLMDFVSLRTLSLALAAAGVALGLALLATGGLGRRGIVAMAGAAAAVIAASSLSFDGLYERLATKESAPAPFERLWENRSGVIAITADRTVLGGGAYDGKVNTNPLHDVNGIFRAYALAMMHPAPKQVLMIGLASGSWAQVVANQPGVEHLTIVEINPGYLDVLPHYPEVASLLTNPKVDIVIDDGRRWLWHHPDRRFDAIVMNTTYHWRAGMTNLLSREFLELARAHLLPGGVHYYNTTESAEAQLTAATVFPFAVRVANFIAVSDTRIVLDAARWHDALLAWRIDGQPVIEPGRPGVENFLRMGAAAVERATGDSRAQLLEYGESVRARYQGLRVATDDNMATEWGH